MSESALADVVEETIALPGRELSILRPRSSEALLDEEAFEREEFLPYWAELWPSSVELARTVSVRSLKGARVVELGCGLAVPTIAAALAGARVLATDWSPDAMAFARTNAERNRAEVATAVCSWSDPAEIVAGAPWDLVLASDVLYERRNVGLLDDLLPRLVGERGEVLLADPDRPHARPFLDAAADRWLIESARVSEAPRVSLHRLRRRATTASAEKQP